MGLFKRFFRKTSKNAALTKTLPGKNSFAEDYGVQQKTTQTPENTFPEKISFLEGYGVQTVEELNILQRWSDADPSRSLSTPIGVEEDGKTFSLEFGNRDNCCGLIDGAPGSGKVELLQSWILSMAVNYHPHDVNFIFINYDSVPISPWIRQLPHVVGDLYRDADYERVYDSLRAETRRRVTLFEKYEIRSFSQYQRLHRNGNAKENMPYLIIVIPDLANITQAIPNFQSYLKDILIFGSWLGISILMCRPGLLSERLENGIGVRINMGTLPRRNKHESVESDIFPCLRPGRAWLRDSYYDRTVQFQTFWSGAVYQTVKNAAEGDPEWDERTAVVRHICEIAASQKIDKLPPPWKPELPREISLDQLSDYNCDNSGEPLPWMAIPVGVYDIPEARKQGVQYINFDAGHYGIYGAPGTGKTSLLQTVLLSLGLHYSPKEVNLYAVDCNSGSLIAFRDMPHMGGVALSGQDEKIQKLFRKISEEIDTRKRLFMKYAVSSFASYRETVVGSEPDALELPAIVIAVDNLTMLLNQYPDLEETFIDLAAAGAAYGVYLIFTANNASGVKFKIAPNIKNAITLELADKGEYKQLLKGTMVRNNLTGNPGRACHSGRQPVEFQTALCSAGENDIIRNDNLKKTVARLKQKWTVVPLVPTEGKAM